MISFIAIVVPDTVANLNPISLISSSTTVVLSFPSLSKHSATKSSISDLVNRWFLNPNSLGITLFHNIIPTDVSTNSPSIFTFIISLNLIFSVS